MLLLGWGLTSITWAAAPKAEFDFRLDLMATRQEVTMAELAGKPLVVMLWAPDCPHCRLNMPYAVTLYKKLDTASVGFVACSMADRQATAAYVAEWKLPFPVTYKAHLADYITDGFTANGWPVTFVFNGEGGLVGSCDDRGQPYVEKVLALVGKAESAVEPVLERTVERAAEPTAGSANVAPPAAQKIARAGVGQSIHLERQTVVPVKVAASPSKARPRLLRGARLQKTEPVPPLAPRPAVRAGIRAAIRHHPKPAYKRTAMPHVQTGSSDARSQTDRVIR